MAIPDVVEFLIDFPAFAKVGISFLGILLINRLGISLGFSILIFSLFLPLWSGAGLNGLSFQMESLASPESILLPFVILVLLFFSHALGVTGRIERTTGELKSWLQSKRVLFIGFPALIGMLPMPGGAIFSAPLVDSVDSGSELTATEKAAVNYWFRHIWEYWWPLYPGVILALKYSGLPLPVFFLIHLPFTFAALMGGYFFILRKSDKDVPANNLRPKINRKAVFSALGPIIILVGTAIAGSIVLSGAGLSNTLAALIAMLGGLLLALLSVFAGNGAAWKPSLMIFRTANPWLMVLLVVSLGAFSAALKCPIDGNGSTLVTAMRDELINSGTPVILVIMAIPFISGMVTGVAFGFVGASFPIVFPLIGSAPSLGVAAATTALAYSFGYMGMMLSPMHVCFVVSCQYFRAPLISAYRYLAGPFIIIILTAFILSGSYYLFL